MKAYIKRLKQEAKWNKDILESVDGKCGSNPYIKELLDTHLRTAEVNEDDYDFANANVFEDNTDENYVEIQARNIGECGMSYFYIHPDRSEVEYKKRKVALVGKVFMDLYKKNLDMIDACTERNNLLLLANNALYHTEGLG